MHAPPSPWIEPFEILTTRLLASPRVIARNEPAATFVLRLYRLWEKFVERRIRARHSPRVFLATHAREVCCERPLNHNHNGGRIALRSKCTSASGSFFYSLSAVFEAKTRSRLANEILSIDPILPLYLAIPAKYDFLDKHELFGETLHHSSRD